MKNIALILLTLLSMSCQAQINNKEVVKEVDQLKLRKYYKKLKKRALTKGKNVKEIYLQEATNIDYILDDDAIKINNHYPHPSKEFSENMPIHSYVVKVENLKVCFWRGDIQVLETDKVYPKLVANFITTTENLTRQQGTYNPTMRLMEGNILVFPDGLKIGFDGFAPRYWFNGKKVTQFARLKISKNQDKEHANISIGKIIKAGKDKSVTTYTSEKWKKYKVELIGLLENEYIDIVVSKNRKDEINEIKKIGKDSIVQLALDIRHNEIDLTNFEFITVSANHQDVYVNFINSVKYIPLNTEFTTDLTVSILGRTTSYNSIANPSGFRSKDGRKYYNPNDKENKKVIQFVFDAINKSKEVGNSSDSNTKGIPEEINMTIKEKETYYDVLDASGTQESNYKVKKETGEIYDVVHFSLEIDPDAVDNEETVDLTNYFIDQINAKACVTNEVLKNTFENIYDNIQNNGKPVHDGEMGSTTSGYSLKRIGFSHLKYGHKLEEVISIYDSNDAITYYLFKKEDESFNMYYERHFSPQLFDEQKYKSIVAHFCENIVNKDFKKADLPSKITYQTLSKMDRDALIYLAKSKVDTHLKLVKEKPFNYSGIHTKVLKNSTTFIVYFEQSFKYVPLHSAHYYGFYVNLLDDDLSRLNRSNEAANAAGSYYSPSSQDLEKIAFVKKAISYKEGQNVVVNEKEKHYELGYITSGEKVDKKTGKVFDFWDRIYAPEEDPLVEMLANPCPTQKELKKGFKHLKKLILKNGKEDTDVDDDKYPSIIYNLNDIEFSYNNFPDMKTISVAAKSGFYWIIKSKDGYQIDVKDHAEKIAKQKRKVAGAHFCNNLLNFKE